LFITFDKIGYLLLVFCIEVMELFHEADVVGCAWLFKASCKGFGPFTNGDRLEDSVAFSCFKGTGRWRRGGNAVGY